MKISIVSVYSIWMIQLTNAQLIIDLYRRGSCISLTIDGTTACPENCTSVRQRSRIPGRKGET